jgi:hypothetical protein
MCGRGRAPVNRRHAPQERWAWLALGAALLSSSCWADDDCGPPECVGNVLQTCTTASYGPSLTSHACEGTCLVHPSTNEAFCALDDEPDAACGDFQSRCNGTTVVSCHAGYEVERFDCEDNGASLGLEPGPDTTITCVDSPFASGAECAVAWNPDPRCDGTSQVSYFCDGEVKVDCYGRYPTRRQACSAPQICDMTCRR